MISKTQKIWLWIFGAMFLIPEILFLNIPVSISSFLNNFSESSIKSPIYYFFSEQFFTDHQAYIMWELYVEFIGALCLSILLFLTNKKIIATVMAILTLAIFLLICFINSLSHMSLVW